MRYLYLNKHWSINKEYNLDKLLFLMVDRSNVIVYKSYIWFNSENEACRNYDLPAYAYHHCNELYSLSWYKNSKFHRKNNKPAYIGFDGNKQYYINYKFIKHEKPK